MHNASSLSRLIVHGTCQRIQKQKRPETDLFRLFLLDRRLKAAWKHEHAFRQELGLFVAGTLVALVLKVSAFEKLVLIAVLVLVLIVELINSAIEAVVDRISLERHPLSKNAKDFGSAAVLLACLLAAATWAVVLFNRFY